MGMIDNEDERAPSGQALVNDAPAGHRPAGFDPSRVNKSLREMTPKMPGALLALPPPGIWATASEMRSKCSPVSLDLLYVYPKSGKLCDRRWTKWGGEQGQKRGEGYEYTITTLGDAVRRAIRDSDGSPKGGDACGSVHDGAGLQGIAQPDRATLTEGDRS